MIDHVLIDMDGVLCDFVSSALRALGHPDHEVTRWSFYEDLGLSVDEFWQAIERAETHGGFWADLEPYPWMADLIRIATRDGEVPFTIATSPTRDPRCPTGKVAWMRRHLSPTFGDFQIGHQKWLLARPGTLLIDDYDHNVDAFRQAGGQAVLLPQPWNTNRHVAAEWDRIAWIKFVLAELHDAA